MVLQILEVQGSSGSRDHSTQRRFLLSNIAGYKLAQNKIMYVWDVQRCERAITAEKERKNQLEKEAALLCSTAARFIKLIMIG